MIVVNSIKGNFYIDCIRLGDMCFYDIVKNVAGKALRVMRYRELDIAIEDLTRILKGKGLNRW